MTRSFGVADVDRLDSAAKRALDELRPAGFSVGVAAGGALAWSRGWRLRRRHRERPARRRPGAAPEDRLDHQDHGRSVLDGAGRGGPAQPRRLRLPPRAGGRLPRRWVEGEAALSAPYEHLRHRRGGHARGRSRHDRDPVVGKPRQRRARVLFRCGVTLEIPPKHEVVLRQPRLRPAGRGRRAGGAGAIAEVFRRRDIRLAGNDQQRSPRPAAHPDLATGYHRRSGAGRAGETGARRLRDPGRGPPSTASTSAGGPPPYPRRPRAAGAVQSTVPDMARYAAALLRRAAAGSCGRRPCHDDRAALGY